MIKIKIYNFDQTVPLTMLTPPAISSLRATLQHMAISTIQFEVDLYDSKATPVNLRKYNRVKLYDGDKWIFSGYIASWKTNDRDSVTVVCKHLFGLFDRRLTGSNETWNTNAGSAIHGLLTSTNSLKDTKIIVGVNDALSTVNQTFKRQTVYKAWQDIAKAGQVEFEIDENDQLNIKPLVGEDKTSSVVLRFSETQETTNSITTLDFVSEGDDMANDIIGTGNNLTSEQQDLTSQGLYGLLQKVVSYSDQPTQGVLDDLTTDTLTQNKYSKDMPSITLDNKKIKPHSLKLGDTVRVILKKGQLINVDANYRITGLNITWNDNSEPEIKVVLADEFTRNLIPDGIRDIQEMQDRILALERK